MATKDKNEITAMGLFLDSARREIDEGRKDVRSRIEYLTRELGRMADRLDADGSCWSSIAQNATELDLAAAFLRDRIETLKSLENAINHDAKDGAK